MDKNFQPDFQHPNIILVEFYYLTFFLMSFAKITSQDTS
jgi:hypothetical protein